MKIDLRNWMQAVPDDRDVLSLNLCGTHDCVTQYIHLSRFACCQSLPVAGQLEIGVRALDIRVRSNGSRLTMVHGFLPAFTDKACRRRMDMADVLQACYAFLQAQPTETIIFQFKNDSGREMEACFDNLFFTYIRGNEHKWFLENRVPLLGEARGKIVLIRRCSRADRPEYSAQNTGIDFSSWIEQPELVPAPQPLFTGGEHGVQFTVQDRYKYKPEPRWAQVNKPFLDSMQPFSGQYVIQYLSTAGGLKGPRRNAAYINPRFMAYALQPGVYYGTVYVDFPHAALVKKIVAANFEALQ